MLLSLTALGVSGSQANTLQLISKTIPKSQQAMPAIGMGTWITFDVNQSRSNIEHLVRIVHEFFKAGGQMIDSSPMYGFAQQVLGAILPQVKEAEQLFSATKVWTMGQENGIAQMQQSMKLWGLEQMDLMHVHNMLDWQTQLSTLNQWKDQGIIKYTGITTSHGRRHQELIKMLKSNPVDFVQFTYNINDREAEQYLLPLAEDLGVAVVINRPFQTGGLFSRVRNQALPDWAKDIQCENWAQFFLKYVISHPAVTCAIPATSQVKHMQQNMQAMQGDLPDQAMRKEMAKYYQSNI
jgi:diketogulonate reductase-like aldo/keto reductase